MSISLKQIIFSCLFLLLAACQRGTEIQWQEELSKSTSAFVHGQEDEVQINSLESGGESLISLDLKEDQEPNHPSVDLSETSEEDIQEEVLTWDDYFAPSEISHIKVGSILEGPTPYSVNASETFIPASITKLITTFAAMEKLGLRHQFITKFQWSLVKDNPTHIAHLKIIGSGDPTLGAERIDRVPKERINLFVNHLKQNQIKSLQGPIEFRSNDDRLDYPFASQGVQDVDLIDCYGAIPKAFNYQENCGTIMIDGPEKVNWSDSDLDFPLESHLVEGKRTRVRLDYELDRDGLVKKYIIRGTWHPKRTRSMSRKVAIPDSQSWFQNALVSALKEAGIQYVANSEVDNQNKEPIYVVDQDQFVDSNELLGSNSVSATNEQMESFEIESPKLYHMIRLLNKESNNFIADSYFRQFGLLWTGDSENVREASRKFLAYRIYRWFKKIGNRDLAKELRFYDGAGLSRKNKVTPRALLSLLKYFSERKNFRYMWRSLPVAGVDGTLVRRFRGTSAYKAVRAKTGTLSGYYQLAGYVPKITSGQVIEYIPFVVLTKTRGRYHKRARKFQDKVVAHLMDLVNHL